MATTVTIGELSQHFEIPVPADPANGNILTGPSFSIERSTKRRRIEIVVGVDGECIQVYDLKNSNRLASHSLPPQASLTASPCCVIDKFDQNSPRYIYAPLRSKLRQRKSQLVCFSSTSRHTVENQGEMSSVAVEPYDVWYTDHEIIHVEPIATGKHGAHEILILEDDCQMTCLAPGLRHRIWRKKLELINPITENSSLRVEYAFFLKIEQARKFLFKSRSDILPSYELTDNNMRLSQILFLITKRTSDESLEQKHAINVLLLNNHLDTGQAHVEPLVSWLLHSEAGFNDNGDRSFDYIFDSCAGLLYRFADNRVVVIEFSRSYPRVISTFIFQGNGAVSLIPLPKCHFLTLSDGSCSIYDARYKSLLGVRRLVLPKPTTEDTVANMEAKGPDPFIPCTYFQSRKLAVGISGRSILSLPVALPEHNRFNYHKPRLISSLGRGIENSELRLKHAQLENEVPELAVPASDSDLIQIEKDLDQALEKDNINMFRHILDESMSNLEPAFSREMKNDAQSTERISSSADSPSKERFHHNFRSSIQLNMERFGVLFALGYIFDWNHAVNLPDSCPLVVRTWPPRIFQWIVSNSFLTAENVERALTIRRHPCQTSRHIEPKNIVKAIATFDTSLQSLLPLTTKPTLLTLSGIIEITDHLIQSLDITAITNAYRSIHKDQTSFLEDTILAEEEAAMYDLNLAAAYLDVGVTVRALALRNCLESLSSTFPEQRIIQAFRSQLSVRKVMFIIDVLRVELERNGWTSCSLDQTTLAEDVSDGQEEALYIICKLLNCALDAVGTGGWFQPQVASLSTFNQHTSIPTLNEVTAAALEGVQDSVFFAGFLKDFLRFDTFMLNSGKVNKSRRNLSNVFLEPRDLGLRLEHSLPFGTKPYQLSHLTRTIAGGEVKKRRPREIGEQLSHAVKKHAHEVLRL